MCYFRAKIMKTEGRTKRFFVFYAEVHLIFRILGKDTINKIKKWN